MGIPVRPGALCVHFLTLDRGTSSTNELVLVHSMGSIPDFRYEVMQAVVSDPVAH
jgi:hypothetical protein